MSRLSAAIRRMANRLGYDLIRKPAGIPPGRQGDDPWRDMKVFVRADSSPVIFDVGANVGQTCVSMRADFPKAVIHAFEPSPRTFEKLHDAAGSLPGVKLWNFAMGAAEAEIPFLENSNPDMSSFLPPGRQGWGKIERETMVPVNTVDCFCAAHGIERIDILKSDTQGYDLEVFKGAVRMMREKRIGMLFFEVIFSEMYEKLPKAHEILAFLEQHDFLLVGFYHFAYQENRVGWGDALFVHRSLCQPTR